MNNYTGIAHLLESDGESLTLSEYKRRNDVVIQMIITQFIAQIYIFFTVSTAMKDKYFKISYYSL